MINIYFSETNFCEIAAMPQSIYKHKSDIYFHSIILNCLVSLFKRKKKSNHPCVLNKKDNQSVKKPSLITSLSFLDFVKPSKFL